MILGRTHGGAYDGWYGRTFKNKNVDYDLDAVRQSVVALALQTTTQRIPDDETIVLLRDSATVVCAAASRKRKFG